MVKEDEEESYYNNNNYYYVGLIFKLLLKSTIWIILGILALFILGSLILLIIQATLNKPPKPSIILQKAPPKSTTKSSGRVTRSASKKNSDNKYTELNELLIELLTTQIRSGHQLGIQVSVWLRGREIVQAYGGMFRSPTKKRWEIVTPNTLFMGYSIGKGIAATALLKVVESGKIESYDDPVVKYWPKFASTDYGKSTLTVAEATSHRGGLRATPIHPWLVTTGDWETHWNHGLKFIENLKPEWTPGKFAAYHPVSHSWIIGGIIQHSTGLHISDAVQKLIVQPLEEEGNLFMGKVPELYHKRIAMLENQTYFKFPDNIKRSFFTWLGGLWEGTIFGYIGNHEFFRTICLPSSNSFANARSIAKMYSALANNGIVDDETFVLKKYLSEVLKRIQSVKNFVNPPLIDINPFEDKRGRLSCGFTPWKMPLLTHTDHQMTCLSHNGMGGCVAFADPKTGLSICVMKNSYEPVLWKSTSSSSQDVEDIIMLVRDWLSSNSCI